MTARERKQVEAAVGMYLGRSTVEDDMAASGLLVALELDRAAEAFEKMTIAIEKATVELTAAIVSLPRGG